MHYLRLIVVSFVCCWYLHLLPCEPNSLLDRLQHEITRCKNIDTPDLTTLLTLLGSIKDHRYENAIVNYRYPKTGKTVLQTVLSIEKTQGVLPVIEQLVSMGARPDSDCLSSCIAKTGAQVLPIIDCLLQAGAKVEPYHFLIALQPDKNMTRQVMKLSKHIALGDVIDHYRTKVEGFNQANQQRSSARIYKKILQDVEEIGARQ